MAERRRICIVTGSRAEYGLLKPIMAAIRESDGFELQTVVTGMHAARSFGMTRAAIEADGFAIDWQVDMLVDNDSPVAVTKSMGLGTIGFADAFARLRPDLVMLLGDRFELLPPAQAALVARIPLAHISGGDVTEAAMDESIRHALTKMASLHFATNAPAARRIRQMGEADARVFDVGNPAIDTLLETDFLDRAELEETLGFRFRARNALVTFHPVTLDDEPAAAPFAELLAALDALGQDTGIIFTMPNADTFGRVLVDMIHDFTRGHPNAVAHTSLGQRFYWSLLNAVDMMIGNSSSGLLEAPSLKKPTVNIGDRQKGRLRGANVVDCPANRDAILAAIDRAATLDLSDAVNPYGDGRTTPRIMAVLAAIDDFRALVKKPFIDRRFGDD